MIHPTTSPSAGPAAAAGNKGKPSTLQTIITTAKQDYYHAATKKRKKILAEAAAEAAKAKAEKAQNTTASTWSGVANPEQDGNTTMTRQGLRKDSKVAEQIPEKGPDNGGGLLEDWKNSSRMAKGKEDIIKGENDGKGKPVGAGELGEIYDSGSDDDLGDGSEHDANDDFDDAARPGQGATQYGWL